MNPGIARSTGKRSGTSLRTTFILPLLFIAVASQPSLVMAQSAGRFIGTGNMTTARSEHTATLLADGRVLLAGGSGAGDSELSSAELYDPSSATFTATGSMAAARRMHTATLLPNGQVLIVGGIGAGGSALSSAELYDPSSGTFTATGNMTNARGWHTAILLANRSVLIVGGYGKYPTVAGAELYDPVTGTFAVTGAYLGSGACDFCPPAILLADGRVLFAGQYPAQLYDPATGSFSLTGTMIYGCDDAATLLTNGKVLFAGGEGDECGRSSSAELYDPVTGQFASTGNMAWRRSWHTLTLLPSGMVLAAGGETDSCNGNFCMFAGSVASAELYNPSTGAFVPTGGMAAPRETHTATLLKDGSVLMAGGLSYGGINLFSGGISSAELYVPPAPVWQQQAITAMKTAAGSDSLNFWQWAWYWQNVPPFAGAPSGFGVAGSISPGLMAQIIAAGGGDPLLNVSAEWWVPYYLQAICAGCWDY
jgi:hypothetical protein